MGNAMTEAEVKTLEAEVLAVPLDTDAERAWAAETAVGFRKTEQRLVAEFKLWRFVRDDARMMATAKELASVRQCLAYLDGVLR
jgi:hypothetical protein